MQIDILWRDERYEVLESALLVVCARILEAADAPAEAELSVLLTDDEEISDLNEEFRGLSEPTDVLSFPLQEGEGAGMHAALGDVVISMEYAVRQAQTRGWSTEMEIDFLLVHGVLHLLGWDHLEPEEASEMEAETARIWSQLHANIPLPSGFLTAELLQPA